MNHVIAFVLAFLLVGCDDDRLFPIDDEPAPVAPDDVDEQAPPAPVRPLRGRDAIHTRPEAEGTDDPPAEPPPVTDPPAEEPPPEETAPPEEPSPDPPAEPIQDAGSEPTSLPDDPAPEEEPPDAGPVEEPPVPDDPPAPDPEAACHPEQAAVPPQAALTLSVSPDATCWAYLMNTNHDLSALFDLRAEEDVTLVGLDLTVTGRTVDYDEDVCGADCASYGDHAAENLSTYLYVCLLFDAATGATVADYQRVWDDGRLAFPAFAWPLSAGEERTLGVHCAYRGVDYVVRTARYTFSASALQATDASGALLGPERIGITDGPFPYVTIEYVEP